MSEGAKKVSKFKTTLYNLIIMATVRKSLILLIFWSVIMKVYSFPFMTCIWLFYNIASCIAQPG